MRDDLPIAEPIQEPETIVVLAERSGDSMSSEAGSLGIVTAVEVVSAETNEWAGRTATGVAAPDGILIAGVSSAASVEPTSSSGEVRRETRLVYRSWPFRLTQGVGRAIEVAWGTASLLVLLAIVSGIPGLQILTLGYLLEVSGRIGRYGRWQDVVPGCRRAARLGSMALGTVLCLLPIAYLGTLVQAAEWIDAEGQAVTQLKVGRLLATVFLVPHLLAALFCGGKLRYFFWPLLAPGQLAIWSLRWILATPPFRSLLEETLGRIWPSLTSDLRSVVPLTDFFVPMILAKHLWHGTLWRTMRDGFWEMLIGLRLPELFWLGARGLAGSVGWLFLPTLALIGGTVLPDGPAVLSGTLGVVLLAIVCLYLPVAQVHVAVERRLGAMFDLGAIREQVARSPLRHSLAMIIVLASAVPLYLFKIEMVDPGLWWALGLIFIVFSLPARWVTGWAYRRSTSRSHRTWLIWRWPIRMTALGAALAFSIFVSVTRFTSWGGAAGLFEQHAFLVPAPFTKLF